MGALMDKIYAKSHNKNGKFRPWLLRSAPMLCVGAIALWTVPTFLEGIPMLAALFICKILYEGMYTMFNIPMGSLLSAMANDDGERATLSSARGFGSLVGNIIPMVLFPILLEVFNDTAMGYSIGAAVCAVIGLVMCLGHYFLTEERNLNAVEVEDPKEGSDVKLTDILGVFAHNRPFLALCLHGICICTMQNVTGGLGTYMFGDVLGSLGLMAVSTGLSMPLGFLVMAVAPFVVKKLGLERTIRYCLLAGAGVYGVLFALHILTAVNVWVHIILAAVGMGLGSVSIYMQWGMVGEVIDYNEMITGKRTEGSIYGTFNLSRRIGNTIGSSAAVILLGLTGYSAELAEAGMAQSAATIFGIKFLNVGLPAIFLLGSWIAFKFIWNITPEMRSKMAAFKNGGTQD